MKAKHIGLAFPEFQSQVSLYPVIELEKQGGKSDSVLLGLGLGFPYLIYRSVFLQY